jgi:hypothetical protein
VSCRDLLVQSRLLPCYRPHTQAVFKDRLQTKLIHARIIGAPKDLRPGSCEIELHFTCLLLAPAAMVQQVYPEGAQMGLRVSARRWPSQSDSTPPLYVHDSMHCSRTLLHLLLPSAFQLCNLSTLSSPAGRRRKKKASCFSI